MTEGSLTSTGSTYSINPARIVHEMIDGEVIIIQLERGNYFSLAGSGPEIWELIGGGLTASEVSERLSSRNGAEPRAIEDAVRALVTELLDENLLEPAAPNGGRKAAADDAGASGQTGEFIEPKLEKYTDMQDFLLIDPIHDVTEAGWPAVKPGD